MPIVKLPNGQELDFPEGMSEDDMRGAIGANFPEYAAKKESGGLMGMLGSARQAVREFAGTTPEQVVRAKVLAKDPEASVMAGMTPRAASAMPSSPDYGNRADGTKKGSGFFGELKTPDGRAMTELSVGVNSRSWRVAVGAVA